MPLQQAPRREAWGWMTGRFVVASDGHPPGRYGKHDITRQFDAWLTQIDEASKR
jgi:hypothetical protein